MATSWLELRQSLIDGTASFVNPEPSSSCGTETTTFDSGISGSLDFDFENPLEGIEDAINNFGDDIMQVLNDIGAWIPPELAGQGSGSEGYNYLINKPTPVDDVEADQTQASSNNTGDYTTVEGKGNEGQSTWQRTWGDESHWAKTADGSFHFSAAKSPKENHYGGMFKVRSAGATIVKVGECLFIEVENKNSINAGEKPVDDKAKGQAFSIYISGSAAIHSTEDLSISSSGNITLDAGDRIRLDAKAGIDLLAGAPATDTDDKNSEYGGDVVLKAAKFSQTVSTTQKTVDNKYDSVNGESSTIVGNANAAYGIRATDFEINLSGDMYEKIGGRKKTEVNLPTASVQIPGTSLLAGQKSGYIITSTTPKPPSTGVGTPSKSDVAAIEPPVLSVEGTVGGMTVRFEKGDIDFLTKAGNVVIANESGGMASVLTTLAKDSAKVFATSKPGTFVGDSKSSLGLFGPTRIVASLAGSPPFEFSTTPSLNIGPEEVSLVQTSANKIGINAKELSIVYGPTSTIKVGPESIKIDNKAGIYLN
jgi:hypothetical protein